MASGKYDLAIVGGGLSGGLLALALREKRPELRVALIEAEDDFGGNHIWSFFDSDIEPEHRWLVDPLISKSWDSYDVHFPKYSRSLQTGYNSIKSEKFNGVIRQKLDANHLITGSEVKKITKENIRLSNGDQLSATAIVDARGGGDFSALTYGWQKFLGQMLHLKKPHGLDRPIIMDATVDQIDGYHFIYCLPFGNRDVFVEDTYYSSARDLDKNACRQRIAEYTAQQDWDIANITGEEFGQLPVVYGGDFDQFWHDNDGLGARIGARAALAHPVTSYSLPMAVRTAITICGMPRITPNILNSKLEEMSLSNWNKGNFYRMLCAMMFKAAKPEKRYLTLEHTYSKDQKLIERFYAGKTTLLDKAALLSGRPPVPITKALPIMTQYR